jgi:hypothetical protein
MYTVLQRYRVRLGTVGDAAARAEESLVPRLKEAAGFVAYHFLHTGDSTVAALALFETKPAADAGARLLSDWFRSDWPAFRLLAPDLSVAESLTREQANGGGDEDAVLDPVMGAELPVARDRRRIGDRRLLVAARVPERRSAVDRRTGLDRRSQSERRGEVAPAETGVEEVAPIETAVMPERRRIAPAWRRREASRSR